MHTCSHITRGNAPQVLAAVREKIVTREMLRSDSKRQWKHKAQESQHSPDVFLTQALSSTLLSHASNHQTDNNTPNLTPP